MFGSKTSFDRKLDSINASNMSDDEKREARTKLFELYQKNERSEDYSKYFFKYVFAFFYFAMIGVLSIASVYFLSGHSYNLDDKTLTTISSIINLILGGFLGKASDVFDLIANGNSRRKFVITEEEKK